MYTLLIIVYYYGGGSKFLHLMWFAKGDSFQGQVKIE